MWVFVFSVVGPYVANQLGWVAAEVGRQPWIVYGLMRTSEGISKSVPAGNIVLSLVMFTGVYLLLFLLFIYVLDRKIRQGPEPVGPEDLVEGHGARDVLEAAGRRGKSEGKMVDDRKDAL